MSTNSTYSNLLEFGQIGWKSYNSIKKKAMEQEFSWSGLWVSLSIAFFIVVASATCLSLINQSLQTAQWNSGAVKDKIFKLESPRAMQSSSVWRDYWTAALSFFINGAAGGSNLNSAQAANSDYQSTITKWTDYINAEPAAKVKYTATFKNTGKQTWSKDKIFLETGPFLRRISPVKDSSWMKYYRPAGLAKDVKPGESADISFTIIVPAERGMELQENFQLVVADSAPILGSTLRLFIKTNPATSSAANITSSASSSSSTSGQSTYSSNSTSASSANAEDKAKFCIALNDEEKSNYAECQTDANEKDNTNGISQNIKYAQTPVIRVGLFSTTAAQRVKSSQLFDVYAGNNILLSGLPANSTVVLGFDFKTKQYSVSTSVLSVFSDKFIRLVPRQSGAIMTLVDYVNKPGWSSAYNDNTYRNIIEFHYSTEAKKLWMINELSMEDYLRGLAETSDYSPLEFQKTLIVAARTYAMYHYNRGIDYKIPDGSTKHGDEHFHVDATYDQVYKGYGSEQRMPKLSQAIDQTRGITVTHNGNIVVTPFFSRSDGRTRSWEEVWGGTAKAWCKSVKVPQDQGQTLWGHGVGLSARGALIMTRDEGKTWKETLAHFYQNTELKQVYK